MSTAEVGPHRLLDHAGAWTEEAYLALPGDRRVELVDGSLLVAPSTDEWHDRAVAAVRAAVAAVLPDGLEVSGPVALRLSPGRILVPDLIVAAPRDGDDPDEVRDSSVALLVIDVVGRGNGVADRWFKPQLYAGSRIPYAVLIDHDEPFAVGSMLIGGRYHEYAHAEAGQVLRLEEPFALDLDLRTLADPGPAGPARDAVAADDDPADPAAGDDPVDDPADDPADDPDDDAAPPDDEALPRRATATRGSGGDDGSDPLVVPRGSSHALDGDADPADDPDGADPDPESSRSSRLRVVDREPSP